MKLVHITTIPMSLVFLRGQVHYMQRRGLTVQVISSPGAPLDAFGAINGILTFPVHMVRQITPFQDLIAVCRMFMILRRERPVIVHAHTPKGGLLGMVSAFLAGVPVRVYHLRGMPYVTAKGSKKLTLMAAERVACLLSHQVISVSHSLMEIAVADRICPEDKIVVLGGGSGNGVDTDIRFNPELVSDQYIREKYREFGIPDHAPVVLFVGRLARDKGVEDLAQAWAEVREDRPDAHLVIVGPHDSRDPISEQALISLIEDKHVVLTGEVEDISMIYALADMVVLPTYREGFPNVLLEAAAMQLPVVATSVPGCTDAVVDGVTGTLVPSRDVKALTEAILRYLNDPKLGQSHGRAGRNRVSQEFRQDMIWEAIYQEYCQWLRRKGLSLPEDAPRPV